MDDEAGESTGRSELSPFLREVGSLSSPPGEGLTARDILEAHRFEEEERRAEMDGMEDESEGELLAGPLRDAELGMKQNTSRQVCICVAELLSKQTDSRVIDPIRLA